MDLFEKLSEGRTDAVYEHLASGGMASAQDSHGVSLMQWCAYHGDVTALKLLLGHGAALSELGDNFDLYGACFHGHWQLCEYLIEQGADVNHPLPETGETLLHAAICKPEAKFEAIVRILLANGANPNLPTIPGRSTEGFMRDVRTRGETPLHRAAAFASERVIQMLLDSGASKEAKDSNGDSPLTWASWYLRPRPILRLLCYGDFRVRA
jgi:ankyrin repeat protein